MRLFQLVNLIVLFRISPQRARIDERNTKRTVYEQLSLTLDARHHLCYSSITVHTVSATMAKIFTSRRIAGVFARNVCSYRAAPDPSRSLSSWSGSSDKSSAGRPAWSSEEWKRLGLGAELMDSPSFPQNLFFVQMGFGVDQHGDNRLPPRLQSELCVTQSSSIAFRE
jgi:hypothetical protein